jgi:hypothetical protein
MQAAAGAHEVSMGLPHPAAALQEKMEVEDVAVDSRAPVFGEASSSRFCAGFAGAIVALAGGPLPS